MSSRSRALSPPKRWTTRDGSLNGRLRRNRSLIKLKIAVFNPIPIASVIIASAENPGDLRSWRRANLRSFMNGFLISDCDTEILRELATSGRSCWLCFGLGHCFVIRHSSFVIFCDSFHPERFDGIYKAGTPRWQKTGDKRDQQKRQQSRDKGY